jgi:hypothetical protein
MKVSGTRRETQIDQLVIPTATTPMIQEGACHKEKIKRDDQLVNPTVNTQEYKDYLQDTCLHGSNTSPASYNHDLLF